MNFSIKCQTFVRLTSVCNFFEPTTRADVREKINTLRLENKDGKCFAIATNEKIAVVEFLHNTDQPDGCIHVIRDEALIKQCEIEMQFDSNLHFTAVKEIAVATAKTDLGYSHPENCCYWWDDTPLNNWRNWAPSDNPAESTGAMYWNINHIETLVRSSPSGQIVFPEFINSSQPLVLRDRKSPNWAGLFIPDAGDGLVKQAEIPEWWFS